MTSREKWLMHKGYLEMLLSDKSLITTKSPSIDESKIYDVNPETHDIHTGLPTGSYCWGCGGYNYTFKNYESKRVCNWCKKQHPEIYNEDD